MAERMANSFESCCYDLRAGEPYRVLIVQHGLGSNGRAQIEQIGDWLGDLVTGNTLLICPTFVTPYQFVLGGSREALDRHLAQVGRQLPLLEGLLITGFSAGGQFSHRFAGQQPQRVLAAAPMSAGSWTLPDGEAIGMLVDQGNLGPGGQRPEYATQECLDGAQRPMSAGWQQLPWLVGCGSLDEPRLASARRFRDALVAGGARVEYFEWPLAHETDEMMWRRVLAWLLEQSACT